MTEENSTPPAATPAGNQNLIIGLVLGAVVLLLFLLVLQMTGGGIGGPSEVDKLKAERDALVAKRGGSGVADPSGKTAQELANRLSSDSTTLAGLVSKMQTILTQREDELKSTRSLYQHAGRELEAARQQLANASVSAAELDRLKRQLADTQALLTQEQNRVAELQKQLAGAADANVMAKVRAELDETLKERDSFQRQFTDLQVRMKTMVASDQFTSLNRDLAALKEQSGKLESDNNKLNYEIQKLRAELDRTRLFVEAEALPAKAKLLYDELAKLQAATPAELQAEYKRIGEELSAGVIDTVSFQTGSSRVSLDKVEEIRRATQASGDESFFLVVGYASKSGGLDTNKKLSADRATRVASVTNSKKKSGQGVQAVFLSQTDRFSPSDLTSNQICEIWEVRK